jgi:hypothetical protein
LATPLLTAFLLLGIYKGNFIGQHDRTAQAFYIPAVRVTGNCDGVETQRLDGPKPLGLTPAA